VTERDGRAVVLAPSPLVTVTIEALADSTSDIHLHAGGQGIWIASMIRRFGLSVRVCAPLGPETAEVLSGLIRRAGIELRAVSTLQRNGAYVHDRRSGTRQEIANAVPRSLGRHELDDLCNTVLVEGLDADVVVLGGPDQPGVVNAEPYRSLARNLTSRNVTVVADLAGDHLRAAAEGGATLVKASHLDLIKHGQAAGETMPQLRAAIDDLRAAGAANVVVTRGEAPALACVDSRYLEITAEPFAAADHHGAGDSMTAAIAATLGTGRDLETAFRVGAAAGALNATRHGLATGAPELIERLAARVDVRTLD
jgi:1-phosphofructokinase